MKKSQSCQHIQAEKQNAKSGRYKMNKKLILLPIMAMFAILLAGVGYAIFDTLNISIANTTITTTETLQLNATINATGGSGVLNCSFQYLTSKSGASWTLLDSNVTVLNNATAAGSNYGVVLRRANLKGLPLYDRYTTTWRAICGDGGENGTVTSAATGTVTIDYTTPTCTYASGLTSNTAYAPTQTWQIQGYNGSSATIQFGSNDVQYLNQDSGTGDGTEKYSYTGSKGSLPDGIYTVTISTSDGTDITTNTLDYVQIKEGTELKDILLVTSGKKGEEAVPVKSNSNLALIIVIGLAAYWFVTKKSE